MELVEGRSVDLRRFHSRSAPIALELSTPKDSEPDFLSTVRWDVAARSACERILTYATLALTTILFTSRIAAAQRTEWPVNGHSYQAVLAPGGISWTDAKKAAEHAGGYLATITSNTENAFVFALVDHPEYWNQEPGGSDLGPWLGGYQTVDTGNPAENWAWVSGEPWSYTTWYSGEPNNYLGAGENYLSYKCYGTAGCRSSDWNDLPDNISVFGTSVRSYVIEFDAASGVESWIPARDLELSANGPNPFRIATTVHFSLPAPGLARLSVVDVAGRVVRVLAAENMTAGAHTLAWDGRDATGRQAPPGCYFVRLLATSGTRWLGLQLVR
jgi:hypothetical protein